METVDRRKRGKEIPKKWRAANRNGIEDDIVWTCKVGRVYEKN